MSLVLTRLQVNPQKLLGKGGFGIVFEGIWDDGKFVAVKRVPLTDIASNAQEEELLQGLNHPNVIKFFHAESDSFFRYYALELCEASLDKIFLKDGDPKKYCGIMPPHEDVLLQLAVGLEYIHKMDLIHRDVKPENVLICVGGDKSGCKHVLMKWSDFGLSKRVNERGTYSMSGVKGTIEWLAPEILKLMEFDNKDDQTESGTMPGRRRGTVKSDVYAEGLVFAYFLSNGIHPFGPSGWKIPANIAANKPINLTKIQPKHARRIVRTTMLADKPENRGTSSVVVEILKNFRIKPEEKEQRLLRLCGRRRPNLKRIESLIREGVNINCVNRHGSTPLLQLARGHFEGNELIDIVQALIAHGIDVNRKDKYGLNALQLWCRFYAKENLIDIIRLLIQNGIDVNNRSNSGSNALHILCDFYTKENVTDIVQLLISQGVDVNCKDKYGRNAIHILCRRYKKRNLIDLVQILIKNGIDINCKTIWKMNALHVLCTFYQEENLIEIVRLLIKHGIDINSKNDYGQNTLFPLSWSYLKENLIDIIRLLIEHGIDINCKDEYGRNALHFLCSYYLKGNLIDIVRLLVENGIDLNCKDGDGWNPLFFLCEHYANENLIDIVRLLIENGIEKNHINDDGKSPVSLLVSRNYSKKNRKDIFRLLLKDDPQIEELITIYDQSLTLNANRKISEVCTKRNDSEEELKALTEEEKM